MNIIIDKKKEYSTFEGFGASGAWWAQEVGKWEHIDEESGKAVRDRISELLYSKENGIGLRTYRYNIGAGSKNSGNGNIKNKLRRTESFLDENGEYDFTKDSGAVYMMKRAVIDGADEIILFVNSPIESLTKNRMAHCDKKRAFRTNLSQKNYKTFAKYCLDVTEHFVNEGLPIKYLSPINEPVWKWTGGQEGCHYRPRQAGNVMKIFAEEMAKRLAKSIIQTELKSSTTQFLRSYSRQRTRTIWLSTTH